MGWVWWWGGERGGGGGGGGLEVRARVCVHRIHHDPCPIVVPVGNKTQETEFIFFIIFFSFTTTHLSTREMSGNRLHDEKGEGRRGDGRVKGLSPPKIESVLLLRPTEGLARARKKGPVP